MARSAHEEKAPDPTDTLKSIAEACEDAPPQIKDLVIKMEKNFAELKKVLDVTEEEKKESKDFKHTQEYKELIWLTKTQFSVLHLEGLRVVKNMVENPLKSLKSEVFLPAVDDFAIAIGALAEYIKDPTNQEAGRALLKSANDLDYTANTGQPGSIAGQIFGRFLMVVGQALAVAGVLGVAIAGLSAIGVGFAATAIQSIASTIVCGSVSGSAFIGLEAFLVGVLGMSIRRLGSSISLQSDSVPREPMELDVLILQDLYEHGQKVPKGPKP